MPELDVRIGLPRQVELFGTLELGRVPVRGVQVQHDRLAAPDVDPRDAHVGLRVPGVDDSRPVVAEQFLDGRRDQSRVRTQFGQLIGMDDDLVLRDANIGVITRLERTDDEDQWRQLREALIEIKQRFPDETAIALRLAPGVSYNTLIQVMDRVGSTQQVQLGTLERVELFPDISLGDAPTDREGSA